MALAPATRPRRVRQAASVRALAAAGGFASCRIAGLAPAGAAAVAVAAVAAAAQHHLGATACAQEQAPRWVHAHLGQAEGAVFSNSGMSLERPEIGDAKRVDLL